MRIKRIKYFQKNITIFCIVGNFFITLQSYDISGRESYSGRYENDDLQTV
jgi:hypothetical protein